MDDRILYQTVEDRNNPDYVEQHGPFLCTNKTAWLGHGYYFWDTFISLAHWWGENYEENGYMICQSSCNGNMEFVYDLVADQNYLKKLKQLLQLSRKTTM